MGGAILDNLLSRNNNLTIIGRSLTKKIRQQDNFIKMDLETFSPFSFICEESTKRLIFISNAGIINPLKPTIDLNLAELIFNTGVNFHSPLLISCFLCKEARVRKIPLHIINISTGAAKRPIPDWATYCASKAAIRIALDCLEKENDHLTVSHFDPGVINTGMQKLIRDHELKYPVNLRNFSKLREKGALRTPNSVALEILNSL